MQKVLIIYWACSARVKGSCIELILKSIGFLREIVGFLKEVAIV